MSAARKKKTSGVVPAGFEKVERREVIGWEHGKTWQGILGKIEEGRRGAFFYGVTEEGEEQVISAPTVLRDHLDEIRPGTEVYIHCVGQLPTKSGRSVWDFEVYQKA